MPLMPWTTIGSTDTADWTIGDWQKVADTVRPERQMRLILRCQSENLSLKKKIGKRRGSITGHCRSVCGRCRPTATQPSPLLTAPSRCPPHPGIPHTSCRWSGGSKPSTAKRCWGLCLRISNVTHIIWRIGSKMKALGLY
jgi:hypothetical protein